MSPYAQKHKEECMLPIISESKKDSRRRISTEIAPHFVVNAPVVRDISGRLSE